jgi:hypothetical protein
VINVASIRSKSGVNGVDESVRMVMRLSEFIYFAFLLFTKFASMCSCREVFGLVLRYLFTLGFEIIVP